MTDVIKIALERRAQLSAELARLDEFIRMAESLVQEQGAAARASVPDTAVPAPHPAPEADNEDQLRPNARPMVFRQKSAG
ncbi:MAG: hypothetical protein AAF501_17710 [Pseudomonadota bacterium]